MKYHLPRTNYHHFCSTKLPRRLFEQTTIFSRSWFKFDADLLSYHSISYYIDKLRIWRYQQLQKTFSWQLFYVVYVYNSVLISTQTFWLFFFTEFEFCLYRFLYNCNLTVTISQVFSTFIFINMVMFIFLFLQLLSFSLNCALWKCLVTKQRKYTR